MTFKEYFFQENLKINNGKKLGKHRKNDNKKINRPQKLNMLEPKNSRPIIDLQLLAC
jgi:hypothetical protein